MIRITDVSTEWHEADGVYRVRFRLGNRWRTVSGPSVREAYDELARIRRLVNPPKRLRRYRVRS